jgi:hypothetical protein
MRERSQLSSGVDCRRSLLDERHCAVIIHVAKPAKALRFTTLVRLYSCDPLLQRPPQDL